MTTDTTTDTKAFNQQLCELVPLLQKRAFRYCTNEADAADLAQSTVERALKYRDHFELGTNMSAWLSTIMHNTYVNTWRKRKRHYAMLDRARAEPREEAPRPDDGDGAREVLQILETLREGLSEDYYETLLRCDVGGESYKTIAAQMGVPIGTVMSRLYRARRRARALVRQTYDTELLEATVGSV